MAKPNWHPERIKAAVRMRGVSLTDVATELGITASVVSAAIRHRSRRSRRVEQAIARIIGREPKELWPDRYDRHAA